eukprot:3940388-Rhodomonas_salina.7
MIGSVSANRATLAPRSQSHELLWARSMILVRKSQRENERESESVTGREREGQSRNKEEEDGGREQISARGALAVASVCRVVQRLHIPYSYNQLQVNAIHKQHARLFKPKMARARGSIMMPRHGEPGCVRRAGG